MSTHYIPIFQALVDYIERTKDWVVILTPGNSPCADGFRSFGLGLLPLDRQWTGRTALFKNGGKISVAELPHRFEGADGQFSVMLLGFEEIAKLTAKDEIAIAAWRKRAKRTITLGTKPGELQFH